MKIHHRKAADRILFVGWEPARDYLCFSVEQFRSAGRIHYLTLLVSGVVVRTAPGTIEAQLRSAMKGCCISPRRALARACMQRFARLMSTGSGQDRHGSWLLPALRP